MISIAIEKFITFTEHYGYVFYFLRVIELTRGNHEKDCKLPVEISFKAEFQRLQDNFIAVRYAVFLSDTACNLYFYRFLYKQLSACKSGQKYRIGYLCCKSGYGLGSYAVDDVFSMENRRRRSYPECSDTAFDCFGSLQNLSQSY